MTESVARPRKRGWLALREPVLLALLLLVVGLVPLLWDARYYFRGDTQIAYLGWWYHLGERVLHGDLPLMEPLAWEAGNYVAEGQWGLFSPLTLAVALLTTVVPDVVVLVTALKLALVVVGGLGTYAVTRSYRVPGRFAVVAGLVVGLSGEAVFLDWPSWVNGQMGVALLPWAWWSTRRAMAGRNPAPALVLCYLTVSIGYVYCAIYLAAVLAGCLVDAVISRNRHRMLTVLALCGFSALVALAVYLPGILTAPVTGRSSWRVTGYGRMTMDVQGFIVSMLPTPTRYYLAWLVPVVVWLDLARVRRCSRDLAGAFLAAGVLTLWVLGPAAIGPLRWPARVIPALMVPLVVLIAVLAARCLVAPVSRGRLLSSIAWVCAACYLVVVRDPHHVRSTALGAALVVAALALTAWSMRRHGARVTAGVVLAATVALLVFQVALHPTPGAGDRNLPAAREAYDGRLASARGDVMVLGNAETQIMHDPTIADELLVGSSWYLNSKDVQNGYTTINFRAFRQRFCRVFNGGTCAGALAALQSNEPATGRQWADLLSVSTLAFFRPAFTTADLAHPPAGWTVSEATQWVVVWTRDEQLPTAGGVVDVTGGSAVDEEMRTDRAVRLRVRSVGPRGGTVTLSRLAWPGYSVEGGALAAPLDGMLVRVALPAGSAGSTVTLRWAPPGWALEVAALSSAVLLALLWSLLSWLLPRRRRRRRPRRGRSVEGELSRRRLVDARGILAERVAGRGEGPRP